MNIVITEWALQSYLDLKHARASTDDDYKTRIRPRAEKLKDGYPSKHEELNPENNKYWSIATDHSGKKIKDRFKMKWHQLNDGKTNQLRLCVVIFDGEAYLCRAYTDKDKEKFEMATLKVHAEKIRSGRLTWRELL